MKAARGVLWLAAVAAAVVCSAGPAAALVASQDGQANYEIPLRQFDLYGYETPAIAADRAQVEAAVERTYGGTWRVYAWNPQTRTPSEMFGSGAVVSGPLGASEDVRRVAEGLILTQPDAFRANLSGLRFTEATSAPPVTSAPDGFTRPGKWAAHFQQVHDGIDVIGGEVHMTFTDAGRLFTLGSTYYPGIAINVNPTIPPERAKQIARDALPFQPQTDSVEPDAPLRILPVPMTETAVDYHLVWQVRVHTEKPVGIWVTMVDAHSGAILSRTNDVHFDFLGTAVEQVERTSYCDGSQEEEMPYISMTINNTPVTADDHGNWHHTGNGNAQLNVTFNGPYVSVHYVNGATGHISATITSGVPYEINYTDANSHADEREVFRTISDVHDFFETFAPGWHFTNTQIDAYVNIDQTCNAYWNSYGIHFYRAGDGCADTGEMMDCVAHEYGHGVQDAILGQQGSQGLGEGNGDILGNLISMQSVVCRGFYDCSGGIRDSHNTLQYPDDVIGHEDHDAGRVIAGFQWDAMQQMIATEGQDRGRWDAAYNWHWGRVLQHPTDQPAQVLATFIADDNDGDLTNGTPRFDALCMGARNHGFSCPTSTLDLTAGACETHHDRDQWYRFDQQSNYWTAVGVNPASGDDKDIRVYTNEGLTLLASSTTGSGANYVVGDFNHIGPGPYRPYVSNGLVTRPYVIEWDSGTDMVTPGHDLWGSVGGGLAGCGVVRAWDVYLEQGKSYRFYLSRDVGDADVRVSLFRNPANAPYWAGRTDSEFELPIDTGYEYTAPAGDFYGVVVFNNSRGSPGAMYTLRVQESPVPMQSGVCQDWSTSPRMFSFNQAQNYWTAVAVNPSGSDVKTLEIYDNPDGANLSLATADTSAGTNFIVGDFNHNPMGTYYPRVSAGDMNAVYVLNWDDGPDAITIGTDVTGSVGGGTGGCGLINAWDVYLEQGQTYRFLLLSQGQADVRMSLFRNPASDVYWAPRSASEFETGDSTGVSYTAPASDFYGVVVFNNSPSVPSGTYTLRVRNMPTRLLPGTCQTGSGVPQEYVFTQRASNWTCVGVNPGLEDDKDIYVYDNIDCLGNALAHSVGTQGTDFVVGDFNHMSGGAYFALATYGSLSANYVMDWDDGANSFPVGSLVQGTVGGGSGACGLVTIWDVYLTAQTTYHIELDKTGNADIRVALFRNPTNSAYWAARGNAVFERQAGTPFTYTAPATDYYGLVVFNASRGSPEGGYSLRFDSPADVEDLADAKPGLSFPNPYPAGSAITLRATAEGTHAAVHIYDVQGHLVRNLLDDSVGLSPRLLRWDGLTEAGGRAGTGLYFVRAEIGPLHLKRNLLLLR